jgi:hypothetical protein
MAPFELLPIVSRLSADGENVVAGARNQRYLQLWSGAA